MTLIVGLGNPGTKYCDTRHNIGFKVIDSLVKSFKATSINKASFEGELYKTPNFFLLKPLTFMNLSGNSIAKVKSFYKIDEVIVIHDDLDLPFGTLKFKRAGSSGGHNGLKSTDLNISNDYLRVRMGIGKPEHKGAVADYVLSDFNKEEFSHLDEWIDKSVTATLALLEKELVDVKSKHSIKKNPLN